MSDIAAVVGRTPRAVRYALHRHEIPLPATQQVAHVDWVGAEYDWRNRLPTRTIARLYRVTPGRIEYRFRFTPRRRASRGSKYPELNDPGWLRVELAAGTTIVGIARQLGADRIAVRAALRRHGIAVPPTAMPPLERVQALVDPAERATAARRVADDARAVAREGGRIASNARNTYIVRRQD